MTGKKKKKKKLSSPALFRLFYSRALGKRGEDCAQGEPKKFEKIALYFR